MYTRLRLTRSWKNRMETCQSHLDGRVFDPEHLVSIYTEGGSEEGH
jgi:hypothetical protein